MFKWFRSRWRARRHPELDPQTQADRGEPRPPPLPDDLFRLVVRAAKLGPDARQVVLADASRWLARDPEQAASQLEALWWYRAPVARWLAQAVLRNAAAECTATADALVRNRLFSVLARLARHPEFDARMTVVECLVPLAAIAETQDAALQLAMSLSTDDSYYVAEKAVALIGGTDQAARCFRDLLKQPHAACRSLVLRAARRLAERDPAQITEGFVSEIEHLLVSQPPEIVPVALKSLLDLTEAGACSSARLRHVITTNVDVWLPALVGRLDSSDTSERIRIVALLTRVCRVSDAPLERLLSHLSDRRARVREGVARSLIPFGPSLESVWQRIDRQLEEEDDWSAGLWLAAAWESLSGKSLPEERWLVVPETWQMVFFENHAEQTIPVGVRFGADHPLRGRLQREGGRLWLYWPARHGITSSERLLDDYAPQCVELQEALDVEPLLGREVLVTGSWRRGRIRAQQVRAADTDRSD